MTKPVEIKLADLADEARIAGQVEQANRLLLLAWLAYDDDVLSVQDCNQVISA